MNRASPFAVVAASLAFVGAAQASLLVDIRVAGRDPTPPAPFIDLNVFVQVTGAPGNPAKDGFAHLEGSFVFRGGGPATGRITPAINAAGTAELPFVAVAPFNAPGAQRGKSQDLVYPPGFIDLGSLPNGPHDDFVIFQSPVVRFQTPPGVDDEGSPIPGFGTALPDGGMEVRIGRLRVWIESISSSFSIDFVLRKGVDGQRLESAALWVEDSSGVLDEWGFPIDGSIRTGLNDVASYGFSLLLPEPTTLSLLPLASLFLLPRRPIRKLKVAQD